MNTQKIEAVLNPETKAHRQTLGTNKAKCGHRDELGYLTGTVCGRCARRAHLRVVRRGR